MNSIRHRTNDLFVASNLLSCFSVYHVGRLVAEKMKTIPNPITFYGPMKKLRFTRIYYWGLIQPRYIYDADIEGSFKIRIIKFDMNSQESRGKDFDVISMGKEPKREVNDRSSGLGVAVAVAGHVLRLLTTLSHSILLQPQPPPEWTSLQDTSLTFSILRANTLEQPSLITTLTLTVGSLIWSLRLPYRRR